MQNRMDSHIWLASKDGTFSVKTCYILLLKQARVWEKDWPCELLWKTKAPPKVPCFGWTWTLNSCLTQDVLQKKISTFAVDAISMEVTSVLQSSAATLLSNLADMGMFSEYFGVYWAVPQSVKYLLQSWKGLCTPFCSCKLCLIPSELNLLLIMLLPSSNNTPLKPRKNEALSMKQITQAKKGASLISRNRSCNSCF